MSTILKRTKAAAAKKAKKSKPTPADDPATPDTAADTDPETTDTPDLDEPAATEPAEAADTTEETDEPDAADDDTDATDDSDDTDDAEDADAENDNDADDDADDDADEDADEDEEDADDGDGDGEFDFEDDDDLDDDEDAPAPRARARSARQVLIVLALVALVLSGAVFYLLNQVNSARAADAAGDEAVSAARAHAQDLLSYDYRSLDNDFARGVAATTGGFQAQYKQTTSQLVRPQATQQRIIVQAAVMNAGVVSADADHAVVLLFVDRVTSKAGQKKPSFDQDRVRMSMTKVNGKWLVSKLDAL